jgi:nitrogen-specific signal transduction histidine kinase
LHLLAEVSLADERLVVSAREVEVDVERLNEIAQRFELIGRPPKMKVVDIAATLKRLEAYFTVRLPRFDRSIELYVHTPPDLPPVAGNPVLLEWAFENIERTPWTCWQAAAATSRLPPS